VSSKGWNRSGNVAPRAPPTNKQGGRYMSIQTKQDAHHLLATCKIILPVPTWPREEKYE